MPWILTWFVHSINEIAIITRIFDYLLSSPPHTILYLCAAFIRRSKNKLLMSHDVDDEGMLFAFFSKVLFEDGVINID